jgi:hypothetical protein
MPNGCIALEILAGKRVGLPMIYSNDRRPQIPYNGFIWRANRLVYHLNVRKIPRTPPSLKHGLVCHTCDNGWCINPDHLYLGTAQQNVVDLFARHPTIKQKMAMAKVGTQNALGHRLSVKTKRLLAHLAMGNKNMLGKKHTEATKLKISLAKRRAAHAHS